MKVRRIYLDYNATTPLDPAAARAMKRFLSDGRAFGNPSSLHRFGQEARQAVEEARAKIAELLNAEDPSEILFVSSGTEAIQTAILGIARARAGQGRHIVTTAAEHAATLLCLSALEKDGWEVTRVPCDGEGYVSAEAVESRLRPDTILVTVLHANNEVGTVLPVAEIGAICRGRGIPFHVDAVQSCGKVPVDVRAIGCDLLSLSAHKFYGPKGIGALYVRRGVKIAPLLSGHHERGLRGGTENVAGIVGMAAALEISIRRMKAEQSRLEKLRTELVRGLSRLPNVRINGPADPSRRISNTVNFCVEFVEGESLILACDMDGFAVSSGSACASGTRRPSHVLLAMGVPPEIAQGSVRLSLGRHTTAAHIRSFLAKFPRIVARLREISPLAPSAVSV